MIVELSCFTLHAQPNSHTPNTAWAFGVHESIIILFHITCSTQQQYTKYCMGIWGTWEWNYPVSHFMLNPWAEFQRSRIPSEAPASDPASEATARSESEAEPSRIFCCSRGSWYCLSFCCCRCFFYCRCSCCPLFFFNRSSYWNRRSGFNRSTFFNRSSFFQGSSQ